MGWVCLSHNLRNAVFFLPHCYIAVFTAYGYCIIVIQFTASSLFISKLLYFNAFDSIPASACVRCDKTAQRDFKFIATWLNACKRYERADGPLESFPPNQRPAPHALNRDCGPNDRAHLIRHCCRENSLLCVAIPLKHFLWNHNKLGEDRGENQTFLIQSRVMSFGDDLTCDFDSWNSLLVHLILRLKLV